MSVEKAEELFFNHSHILCSLQTHVIFTFPVSLRHHPKATVIKGNFDLDFELPMLKVHDKQGEPYPTGRDSLLDIIGCRIGTECFEPSDLVFQFIDISGGCLCDLFRMIRDAADNAMNHGQNRITQSDYTKSFFRLRRDYENTIAEKWYNNEVIITVKKYYDTLQSVALSETKKVDNTGAALDLRQNLCIFGDNLKIVERFFLKTPQSGFLFAVCNDELVQQEINATISFLLQGKGKTIHANNNLGHIEVRLKLLQQQLDEAEKNQRDPADIANEIVLELLAIYAQIPGTARLIKSLIAQYYDRFDLEKPETCMTVAYALSSSGEEENARLLIWLICNLDGTNFLKPSKGTVKPLQFEKNNFEGAEEGYREALAIQEKVLGTDHPETLRTRENLDKLHERMQPSAWSSEGR